MKRTFPANIDGQIFYIDDDAFELLNNYLVQLRSAFPGDEGIEIVSDIESRIRELFNARVESGACVIVLSDVNRVIETMGRPEDISDDDTSNTSDTPQVDEQPYISQNINTRKKLYRNPEDKTLGGVIGGLAVYLGWNANIMRLFFIIIALCTYFGPMIVIYLLAWMVIPLASTPRQILEMRGSPVNIDTVGRAVIDSSPTPPPYREQSRDGFWGTLFSAIGKVLMAILAFFSGCITLFCTVALFSIIAGIIATVFFAFPAILHGMGLPATNSDMIPILSIVVAALVIGIAIFGSITWGAISVICDSRGMTATAIWSVTILCVISMIVIVCCVPLLNNNYIL